jgi:hypothetical protein
MPTAASSATSATIESCSRTTSPLDRLDVVHADPKELLVAEAADDVEARLEVGRGAERAASSAARSSRERVS